MRTRTSILAVLLFALAVSGSAFALAPGGTNPPPKPWEQGHFRGPVDPMPSYPGPRKKG